MIIILYTNSTVNILYGIHIMFMKKFDQHQTDLDFQRGFQGFQYIFGNF